jgi:2-aminobenzoate-CoA ligase
MHTVSTAHIDTFAADHLPPADQWPEFLLDAPGLQFPAQLNCATELLDSAIDRGWGDRVCIRAPGGLVWTYRDLQAQADRIAHVLVQRHGAGQRQPCAAACAQQPHAGGVLVCCHQGRWHRRGHHAAAARQRAGCHHRQGTGVARAVRPVAGARAATGRCHPPRVAATAVFPWAGRAGRCGASVGGPARLEADMARHTTPFANVPTAATDTCLLAFTSGTTGVPKATMHCHRDVMAVC